MQILGGGGIGARGGISPFPPPLYDTLNYIYIHSIPIFLLLAEVGCHQWNRDRFQGPTPEVCCFAAIVQVHNEVIHIHRVVLGPSLGGVINGIRQGRYRRSFEKECIGTLDIHRLRTSCKCRDEIVSQIACMIY